MIRPRTRLLVADNEVLDGRRRLEAALGHGSFLREA
jgi:hypothetical protein